MEINEDKYTIVFPKAYAETAKKTANMLDTYIPLYNNYYNYELDEKILIFINKPNKQVSNGDAFFNKINMYAGSNGILINDLYSLGEWGEDLAIHELAHSYQLLSTKFALKRKIFRFSYFYFLEPNLFLPSSFMEGNAVLMESLFNNGGRLHSGYSKALLNSLLYNDKLTSDLMLLNTRKFPYYEAKYLVGGFFMKYLYDRYGIDMVNSYFVNHSSSYLFPLALGFNKHFKSDFKDIFNDFKKSYKRNSFTQSAGELITKSDFWIDLSKQNNEIYFITTTMHNESTLNIFDIETTKLEKRKSTFLHGRVFKINNKFYFTSNANINNENFYGLYDEEFNRLKDSKSKLFTYISDTGKDRYYFDTNDSFNKLKLYKNNTFIDKIDSSNIVDDDGDLYYFKNINEKRWLIKNNKKIFSLTSHYAFVVDKDKNFIYFISNSNNGSSLFAWNKTSKEIVKVFRGDDIYNAKKIDNDYFLISVISSDSHKLLKVKSSYHKEKPTEVIVTSLFPNGIKYSNRDFNISDYNHWTSMSVNAISLSFDAKRHLSFRASDISSKLLLAGNLAVHGNIYVHTLKYQNYFNDDFKHRIEGKISGRFDVLLFNFIYENNLYKKRHKQLNLELGYGYLNKRKDKNSLFLSLKHRDKVSNILDSFPHKGYDNSLYINHILSDGLNVKNNFNLYKKLYKGLFLNANMQGAFSTSKSLENKISIEQENGIENEHIKSGHYPIEYNGVKQVTYNDWIVKTSLRVDYEKYLGLYSSYYLSLVKSSIFVSGSNFQFEDNSFNENVFGIKSTFLVGYENEVDFIAEKIYNDIYGKKYAFKISVALPN